MGGRVKAGRRTDQKAQVMADCSTESVMDSVPLSHGFGFVYPEAVRQSR